jgi:hypothetical protein
MVVRFDIKKSNTETEGVGCKPQTRKNRVETFQTIFDWVTRFYELRTTTITPHPSRISQLIFPLKMNVFFLLLFLIARSKTFFAV